MVIDNTKDLIFKGSVIDGISEVQDLINTPIAKEATESNDLSIEDQKMYAHSHNLFRRKINELSTNYVRNYVQDRIAPISKKMIDTDNSLINTQVSKGLLIKSHNNFFFS